MLKCDRPHQLGMNNAIAKGLTEAEKATLRALGAVEDSGTTNNQVKED